MISSDSAAKIREHLDRLRAIVDADEQEPLRSGGSTAAAITGAGRHATFAGAQQPKDASQFFADHGKFYDLLRKNHMLGPVISAPEYEGCEAIIIAFAAAGAPVSYLAYGLATAYLETASTMQPVKEYGGNAYYTRMYDIRGARPAKARELGNLSPGDGAKYCGRGYPQMTGKTNYEKATKKLRDLGYDVDLVANPDLAMRADIAAVIMVYGMMEGWFTGRKLADDLLEDGPSTLQQFVDSRDIINGRDRQREIAGFAIDFQSFLMAAGYRPLPGGIRI